MSESTNLSLPFIEASQAQKHVTHNQAIRDLDAIIMLSVIDCDLATPPATPTDGDRYLVAASATDDWVGQEGDVAAYQDDAWSFHTPNAGWVMWIEDEGVLQAFDGSAWDNVVGSELQNLSLLGINTTADTTNKLSVNSDAILFNNNGADSQVKINKATTGDTASLLFQTAYSGLAEMGLAGSDEFSIKVSPDGTTYYQALTIDPDSGVVDFPNGVKTRRSVTLQGRWFMETDNRWVYQNVAFGFGNEKWSSDGGTGSEPSIDWNAMGFLMSAGEVFTEFKSLMRPNSTEVDAFDIRIMFLTGTADGSSWSTSAGTTETEIYSQDSVDLSNGAGWYDYNPEITEFEAPTTGHVVIATRPTGTITARRYLHMAGAALIEMPS